MLSRNGQARLDFADGPQFVAKPRRRRARQVGVLPKGSYQVFKAMRERERARQPAEGKDGR